MAPIVRRKLAQKAIKHRIKPRDEAINELTKTHTYEEVGAVYGISRQRVEQIVRKFGVSFPSVRRIKVQKAWQRKSS